MENVKTIMKYLEISGILLLLLSIAAAESIGTADPDNSTSLDIPCIEVEKDGQKTTTLCPTATLTSEQEKIINELEQKRKPIINSSSIIFASGYSIATSPGLEPNTAKDKEYYIIQFYSSLDKVDADTRNKLDKSGIVLLNYVTNNAFYAKIPAAAFEPLTDLIAEKAVRYAGPIPLAAKIKPEFLEEAQKNPAEVYNIVVKLFEKPTAFQLVVLNNYMGVYSSSDTTYFVYGTAKGEELEKICNLDFVKGVEKETQLTLFGESSSSNNTYVVIFREWTAENKKQVISIEGIEFIRDTTVGEEGYPAILISANQSTVEKIKEFSFVLDIKPAEEVKDVMPRSETKMTTSLPVFSVIFLILFVWWIKRRD